jgi:hypothetical protein
MTSVRGAITQVEKGRERNYTPKQKKFLKLLAENDFKNPAECAEKAGYKTGYWNLVASLKEDIQEIAEMVLVGASAEAATTLVSLMTSEKPLPDGNMKFQTAKDILDRTGITKKEQVNVDHTVQGGLFFLPVKNELTEEVIDGEFTSCED